MSFQKPSSQLVANKWHPLTSNGVSRYPSPQACLRAALGEEQYKFISETVTSNHVRAACILPLQIPFSHLMNTPWSMSYRAPNWRMIIVSVYDTTSWIDLARSSGAIGWLKASNMTVTYQWEPPLLDMHKLKVRPPNALGVTKKNVDKRLDFGSQKKDYNRDELISDLKLSELTRAEIADKHGISRNRVHILAKQLGLTPTKTIPLEGR